MEDKSFELLTKLYSEFTQFKNDVNEFRTDMNEFKTDITDKVNKNSIILEDLQSKIQEMAEIQESHYIENQKHHQEIVEILTEKITTVELAVKNSNIKAVK
jgi:hypothetical protein